MTDIILIHAPLVVFRKGEVFFRPSGDEFSNYPMGLMYLASFLEKQGLSVRILDVTPDRLTQEDILDIIELEQPTLVGIGATSASVRSAIKIVRAIKAKYKNIPVCFGGAHINCDPEFFNRVDTGFDFDSHYRKHYCCYNCYKLSGVHVSCLVFFCKGISGASNTKKKWYWKHFIRSSTITRYAICCYARAI